MISTKELSNIIKSGEGVSVEYKTATSKLPQSLFETVCAFLNRDGGNILLGVDDAKRIQGVKEKTN